MPGAGAHPRFVLGGQGVKGFWLVKNVSFKMDVIFGYIYRR